MSENLMKVVGINKTFGPTIALNNVDIEVNRGEIRGLIGENGSGKSTVTSIYAGMQKADSGKMFFKGEPWNPSSMVEALEKGVGMILQETGTIAGITVAENIFLGESDSFKPFKTKSGKRFGLVSKRKMYEAANRALETIGATHIKGNMLTGSLDIQDRKLIEIAKVAAKNPELIVVDETTTALSQQGRKIIYDLMEKMRKENKAVIFISHDLDEIMSVCNALTVLRDGKIIRTFTKEEFDADKIRTSMIGREMQGDYYRSDYDPSHLDEISLEAKNITIKNKLNNINLKFYKGEIVGIGGLSHCGMHTFGKVLFGANPVDFGEVLVYNKDHKEGQIVKNENFAMKNKIGYVAKDRDLESLNMQMSIRDNVAIAGLDKFAVKKQFLFKKNETRYVKENIDELQTKCYSIDQGVSQLSGGNKQKVVFAKWLGCDSNILILDCPTRGVDIGVKQTMYQLMYKMKKEGKTIIMISEELPELIGMSDRLVIIKDGVVMKEFTRSESLSDKDIINYMI